jgi:hypothetical protein
VEILMGFVRTVFGHVLPPDMMLRMLSDSMLPSIMCKEIHLSQNYAPISTVLLAKRSWTLAFDDGNGSILAFQSNSNEMQVINFCVVVSQGKRGSNFNLVPEEDVAVSASMNSPCTVQKTRVSSIIMVVYKL